MAILVAPPQKTSTDSPPAPSRARSVWPSRLGLSITTPIVAAFSVLLVIPGIPDLVAPILGGAGNAGPLAVAGLVLTGMLLIALALGWRNPYNPPNLPNQDRLTTVRFEGGMEVDSILEKEFDYAAGATEQAMEHRMTIVNFYLLVAGGAGSGVVALISSQATLAVAATPLLWIITFIGGLFLLQLVALRKAWAGSVMEMNYIKEFYIANASNFESGALKKAFLWNPRSIPETHRTGNVFHYSAILIALLDSGAFLGGIFALGLNTHETITAPGSAIIAFALAGVCYQAHLWVYAMMLIPVVKSKQGETMPMAQAKNTGYQPQPPIQPNTITGSREVFRGKLITVRVDDIRTAGGQQEVREIVQKGPAVVIMAYLEASDEILLIQQYRDAVATAMLELPAGYVNPNEAQDAAAKRELLEETGYEAGALRYLGSFYSSPGWTNEQLHLYLATHLQQISGIQDTNEVQGLVRIKRSEIATLLNQGTITDAKSILGLLWGDRELPTHV